MTIKCAKCGRSFSTTERNEDVAWRQLFDSINKHYKYKHPRTLERITTESTELATLVVGYNQMIELAEIEDPKVDELLDNMASEIVQRLGFEEGEEEEEEEIEIEPVMESDNVVALPADPLCEETA